VQLPLLYEHSRQWYINVDEWVGGKFMKLGYLSHSGALLLPLNMTNGGINMSGQNKPQQIVLGRLPFFLNSLYHLD